MQVLRLTTLAFALAFATVPAAFLLAPPAQAAEAQDPATQAAFESAKQLGTIEAWDAFLNAYPKGFYADLARAYVKQLAATPAAAPASPAAPTPGASAGTVATAPDFNDFPVAAGSWGGIVRDGPGRAYTQIDVLDEGEGVTLLGRSDVMDSGYPWFKIAYRDNKIGYKWGGILCAVGVERPDLYKLCTTTPKYVTITPAPVVPKVVVIPRKPLTCRSGYVVVDGRCVLRQDASTSCGPGFHQQGSKCVPGYRDPPPQQQLPSWQVKAMQHGCRQGEDWNAQEGCHPND